ncbi:response regulator [Planococcus sp. 1R117A]|uniref:response regulator n=1 Tax=Planococcus sp. 1R117A TaxID=3447020 RepID=UPI003EDC35EF
MVKLLIVDDEPIERDGMQAILQKTYPDFEFRQAKNGKSAIEIAETWQPDWVFMDIMMPGMTGLEAIEQIQQSRQDIQFVMVTAFDMFDYARQAIKLGVKDYLLKPSKASEIVATVGKLLEQQQQKEQDTAARQQEQDAFQRALSIVETDVVTQLLFDHVHEVHIDMLVEMLEIKAANEKFVMTVLIPEGCESSYSTIKEHIRQKGNAWVGALYGRQLPIIVFREKGTSFRLQAIRLAKDILSISVECQPEDWFIGIGIECDSLEDIRNSYQKSLIATMDLAIPSRYRFYSDVLVLDTVSDSAFIKQQEKKLFDYVRLGEWECIDQIVYDLIRRFEQQGANVVLAQQRVLEVLWITSRVMEEMGVEAAAPFYSVQAQDYRQLCGDTKQLLEGMKQLYMGHCGRLEVDKIHQIKQWIREHSDEDISLDTLARKVDLSPIYISKMFKEKLGVNYIEFLTACRMERAKKLLSDPEKSLKEISIEIGYHEPNYFSKVFKKMYDVSPKEYRKTLLGIKEE